MSKQIENLTNAKERRQSLLKLGQLEKKQNVSYAMMGRRDSDKNSRKGSMSKKEYMKQIAMEEELLERENENERIRAKEKMIEEG